MATAAQLAARLDRLPMAKHIWYLVTLISLGGGFELYDLFLTAYIAPGLNRAGYFTPESLGVFNVLGPYHVAGIGTFVFALFAGLFVGAICLGHVADEYGRRTVFTFSLVWYSITTAIMAFQTSGFSVDLWRFIAGIGIGVELVTIDTYVAELVPLTHRGRAFAYSQFFQFLAVPVVAFIAYLLVPRTPFGFDGWRWVVLIGSAGAIVIWFIRLGLPESPRWLARRGRLAEAEAITAAIEAKVADDVGPLPAPGPAVAQDEGAGSFAEIWQPPYDRRAIILSVFNFFQTFGYYGFAAWVPTLLIAKGITITTSLLYSFVIAIANPIGPLLCTLIADKMERKWQVCSGAIGIGMFGMLFANATDAAMLIALGVLVTLCNNWMSYSFHSYQAELFPTRIRSRAVGFVYSWSRLSAALSGLAVAYLLNLGGVNAVFSFIAFAMLIVVVSIGGFGPRTTGLALEAISRA
ncbi:MAG TPA: MFS transporter [Acetobacteraceae bacterium]|jgi:MFS transporter, putative metabolite:H+ symporter|nr:MFS transporter [Acetobacteraceae bacterium]